MLNKKIKILRTTVLSLFLVAGMGTGLLLNTTSAEAFSGCTYSYCQNGSCYSNQNQTSCASSNGQLPCTGQINCQSPPDK
jgi:hypothetical protein